MGLFGRAVKRCKEFLSNRSFNISFESEIINYEYGKKMEGRKIDRERVTRILGATKLEVVKGVCYSLLEEDEKALAIFTAESEKRFSRVDECLRWPAVSRHRTRLGQIREELLKARRSFIDKPLDLSSAA